MELAEEAASVSKGMNPGDEVVEAEIPTPIIYWVSIPSRTPAKVLSD